MDRFGLWTGSKDCIWPFHIVPDLLVASNLFVANNLNNHMTVPRAVVVIQQNNLLPGTQDAMAITNRYGDTRSHKCGADVGKAVVIPPGLRMVGMHGLRSEFLKFFLYIPDKGRLKLHG